MNYKNVLVLSPHPDDAEYSLSGTVLSRKNCTFTLFNMTNGGFFDKTSSPSRRKEVKNFWESATNVELIFSNVNHINDKREDEWVNYIESNFDLMFDAILIPSLRDSHAEHRLTHNIGLALTRHLPVAIIEYKTPSTMLDWIPNLYVDITLNYKEKLLRLKNFTSQKTKNYFQSEELQSFHTDFVSRKKGLKFSEPFKLIQSYE